MISHCAFLSQGAIYCIDNCWYAYGDNHAGQLGLGYYAPKHVKKSAPVKVPWHADEIVTYDASTFIRVGTKWFAFGSNVHGQLALGDCAEDKIYSPVEICLPNVTKVLASYNKTFLCSNGKWFACGNNEDGSLGIGRRSGPVRTPLPIGWVPERVWYSDNETVVQLKDCPENKEKAGKFCLLGRHETEYRCGFAAAMLGDIDTTEFFCLPDPLPDRYEYPPDVKWPECDDGTEGSYDEKMKAFREQYKDKMVLNPYTPERYDKYEMPTPCTRCKCDKVAFDRKQAIWNHRDNDPPLDVFCDDCLLKTGQKPSIYDVRQFKRDQITSGEIPTPDLREICRRDNGKFAPLEKYFQTLEVRDIMRLSMDDLVECASPEDKMLMRVFAIEHLYPLIYTEIDHQSFGSIDHEDKMTTYTLNPAAGCLDLTSCVAGSSFTGIYPVRLSVLLEPGRIPDIETITYLSLADCGINNADLSKLMSLFEKMPQLKTLNLGANDLQARKTNCQVTKLIIDLLNKPTLENLIVGFGVMYPNYPLSLELEKNPSLLKKLIWIPRRWLCGEAWKGCIKSDYWEAVEHAHIAYYKTTEEELRREKAEREEKMKALVC